MNQYDRWAEETAHEFSEEGLIEWLATQSFETWHQLALGWNWDDGIEELFWVISQPECDMGTACYIFFLAGNSWVAHENLEDVKFDYGKPYWKMYKKIADRWNANNFKNSVLFPHRGEQTDSICYLQDKSYYIGFCQGVTSGGNQLAWDVPHEVYRFTGERKANSEYQFEGRCRLARFDLWKSRQS